MQTVQCGPGSLQDSEISSLTQAAMQAISSMWRCGLFWDRSFIKTFPDFVD